MLFIQECKWRSRDMMSIIEKNIVKVCCRTNMLTFLYLSPLFFQLLQPTCNTLWNVGMLSAKRSLRQTAGRGDCLPLTAFRRQASFATVSHPCSCILKRSIAQTSAQQIIIIRTKNVEACLWEWNKQRNVVRSDVIWSSVEQLVDADAV